MIRPAFDRAALECTLARIAQPMGAYVSKTDQTAHSDQLIGNAGEFGAPLDQKPTSPHPKLTSETAQQPHPCVQVVGVPIDSTHACASDGAPHS
jgi:hypothetical protein